MQGLGWEAARAARVSATHWGAGHRPDTRSRLWDDGDEHWGRAGQGSGLHPCVGPLATKVKLKKTKNPILSHVSHPMPTSCMWPVPALDETESSVGRAETPAVGNGQMPSG